jgi:hypothetical protein
MKGTDHPVLFEIGSSLLAVASGTDGNQVTVSDAKSVATLRALIEERRRLGAEITKKLIEEGLHSAADEKTEVSPK